MATYEQVKSALANLPHKEMVLATCAIVREQAWNFMKDDSSKKAVEAAEGYVNGTVTLEEFIKIKKAAADAAADALEEFFAADDEDHAQYVFSYAADAASRASYAALDALDALDASHDAYATYAADAASAAACAKYAAGTACYSITELRKRQLEIIAR